MCYITPSSSFSLLTLPSLPFAAPRVCFLCFAATCDVPTHSVDPQWCVQSTRPRPHVAYDLSYRYLSTIRSLLGTRASVLDPKQLSLMPVTFPNTYFYSLFSRICSHRRGRNSESCIKGHRSSSCSHSDRPLYEIKKKGRPVSQCERCRELRSTKRVHSKCTCSDSRASNSHETEKAFGTKRKSSCHLSVLSLSPDNPLDLLCSLLTFYSYHSSETEKRYIPIVPALPNGLKDATKERSSDTPVQLTNPRQQGKIQTHPHSAHNLFG